MTSFIYRGHGLNRNFTGDYAEYFGDDTSIENLAFLRLVRRVCDSTSKKYLNGKKIILIGEEVSGFPGLCRPIEEGGIGFDYKLAMNIPDLVTLK